MINTTSESLKQELFLWFSILIFISIGNFVFGSVEYRKKPGSGLKRYMQIPFSIRVISMWRPMFTCKAEKCCKIQPRTVVPAKTVFLQ